MIFVIGYCLVAVAVRDGEQVSVNSSVLNDFNDTCILSFLLNSHAEIQCSTFSSADEKHRSDRG